MHSIDSSSDTRAALHSGAPSGSRAALHSGDPIVGGAGLGPAGPTDAAVGAHNVYLRTPSAPTAGRRDSQVFEGHGGLTQWRLVARPLLARGVRGISAPSW